MAERTTEDLRDSLFDTLEAVKNNTMPASQALAVCRLSAEIVRTAELELKSAVILAGPEGTPEPALLQLTREKTDSEEDH